MSFVPPSFAAVESNRLSILFYVKQRTQTLATLTAAKSGEDPANPPYKEDDVQLNGKTVNIAEPNIAAVAYKFNNRKEASSQVTSNALLKYLFFSLPNLLFIDRSGFITLTTVNLKMMLINLRNSARQMVVLGMMELLTRTT